MCIELGLGQWRDGERRERYLSRSILTTNTYQQSVILIEIPWITESATEVEKKEVHGHLETEPSFTHSHMTINYEQYSYV